jgi:hypothetical protein
MNKKCGGALVGDEHSKTFGVGLEVIVSHSDSYREANRGADTLTNMKCNLKYNVVSLRFI